MGITMYDSIDPFAIPASAPAVAGYVDGKFHWPSSAWDRFPTPLKVYISCLGTDAGTCLDIETGCAAPSQAPGWVRGRQAAGVVRPILYVNRDNWATVRAAVLGLDVRWWLSTLDGTQVVAGADAVQYAGENLSGGHYDLSLCSEGFFDLPAPGPQLPASLLYFLFGPGRPSRTI